MRTLIVALMAAFFMSGSAYANECPARSSPVEDLAAWLNENRVTDNYVIPKPLAELHVKLVNKYNGTDWNPDRVVVYHKDGAAVAAMHMGECVSITRVMSHAMLRRALGLKGAGA